MCKSIPDPDRGDSVALEHLLRRRRGDAWYIGLKFGDLTLCGFSNLPSLNGLTVRQFSTDVNTLLVAAARSTTSIRWLPSRSISTDRLRPPSLATSRSAT